MLRTVDQIRVLARDMNFDEGLTINNVSLGGKGAFSDVETVRDAINSATEMTIVLDMFLRLSMTQVHW